MTAAVAILLAAAAARPLAVTPPRAAGISAERLGKLDDVVAASIAAHETPGAVVVVGRAGRVVLRKAWGLRSVEPREAMTTDTVFDLASVTKVVATASSVLALVEDGRLRLADRVAKVWPPFAAGGGARDQVTIEQLLTHRGGFVPDDPMSLYEGEPAAIWERKNRQPLAHAPGARFVYSDVGYEVLGEVVRAVSGKPLEVFAAERIFAPLGMGETEFRPRGAGRLPRERIAPAEKRGDRFMRGEVHDPRAWALGGVAGHAGLFATADDVARFAIAMLGNGGGALSPAAVAAMRRERFFGDDDLRGLGWDVATGYSSVRGDLFPPGSFGHSGWTGTSLWLDPPTKTFVVLLTNRVHPDGSGNVLSLRAKVANVVASAVRDASPDRLLEAGARTAALSAVGAEKRASRAAAAPLAPPAEVRAGVDVLEAGGFKEIAGKTVGLVTNQTGRTRDGRSTIDVLVSDAAKAAGVKLAILFSPEHGIRGLADEKVGDSVDAKTGLPVRSLYGDSRRPAPADLAGLDAVVFDVQDAGVRFYTYTTTLAYVLEEAAKAKVAVVVLDRPDPIGGDVVEGPLADADKLSFVAYARVPVRTGLTIGEWATWVNAERGLGATLAVVRMTGWRRDLWYDETGLPWTNPSPNLRSPTQAGLYPGIALLESTNVSVGRGTDAPFEVVGAPWMDAARVVATLRARSIPGVRVAEVRFTPASSAFAGQECRGVRLTVVDRKAVEPIRLGLEIATALRDLHRGEWTSEKLLHLLANQAAFDRFRRGDTAAEIATTWQAARMEWERARLKHLLYE